MSQGNSTPPTSSGKGLHNGKLSSSLKERLKRCGRYHPAGSQGRNQHSSDTHTPRGNGTPLHPDTPRSGLTHSSGSKSFTSPLPQGHTDSGTPVSRTNTPLTTCHQDNVKCASRSEGSVQSDKSDMSNCIPGPHAISFTSKRRLEDRINSLSEMSQSDKQLTNSDEERSSVVTSGESAVSFVSCDSSAKETDNTSSSSTEISNTSISLSSVSENTFHVPPSTTDANVENKACEIKSCANIMNRSSCSSVSEESLEDLVILRQKLQSELKDEEERLRKLKMVKMYREKNDLVEMQRLISVWLGVTQTALADLRSLHPDPRPRMVDILSQLGLEPATVRYDQEEEAFT